MNKIFQRVAEYWKSWGVERAPMEERAIIEQRLKLAGLIAGSDFIDFYAATGGMADEEKGSVGAGYDNDFWSCWNLNQILAENSKSENSAWRAGGWVLFADWGIYASLFLARFESTERSSVWVWHGQTPEKVSESLAEFFERYLAGDRMIGICHPED